MEGEETVERMTVSAELFHVFTLIHQIKQKVLFICLSSVFILTNTTIINPVPSVKHGGTEMFAGERISPVAGNPGNIS